MKRVFNIISILVIITTAYIATLNAQNPAEITIWGSQGVNEISKNTTLLYVILFSLLAGILAGAAWMSSYFFLASDKLKEYKRKLEQTSISEDHKDSRVSVLEAKIEVLEKALKSALEKND